MTLDKIEIARRQLGAALALFLENLDPVSVHALACGGGEVAEHLPQKVGKVPFREDMGLSEQEYRALRNKYWNAFKHVTTKSGVPREDQELLDAFTDEVNDHVLMAGWTDYVKGSHSLPIEAQIFLSWYYAMNPERVKSGPILDNSIRLFGNDIPNVSRKEAKRRLHFTVNQLRSDVEAKADPNTDQRPLVMDLSA
jgi:hypothetical protein